jgi:hypothetical protein
VQVFFYKLGGYLPKDTEEIMNIAKICFIYFMAKIPKLTFIIIIFIIKLIEIATMTKTHTVNAQVA